MEGHSLPFIYFDENFAWNSFYSHYSEAFKLQSVTVEISEGVTNTLESVRLECHPSDSSAFANLNDETELHKRPYLYVYVLPIGDVKYYMDVVKQALETWIQAREKHSEWLIIHTSAAPFESEEDFVYHLYTFSTLIFMFFFKQKNYKNLFDKIETDLKNYVGPGKSDLKRLRPCYYFDKKMSNGEKLKTEYQKGLAKSLNRLLGMSISSRIKMVDEKVTHNYENKANDKWDYLKFFSLKENLAVVFNSIGLYEEALQKYEELRNLYYECVLINPAKLRFKSEKFFWTKENINPILSKLYPSEQMRVKIHNNDITEFNFLQYVFSQQAYFMMKVGMIKERLAKEIDNQSDRVQYMKFCPVFTYHGVMSLLEALGLRGEMLERADMQKDLCLQVASVRNYALGHLESFLSGRFEVPSTDFKFIRLKQEISNFFDNLKQKNFEKINLKTDVIEDEFFSGVTDRELTESLKSPLSLVKYIQSQLLSLIEFCKKAGLQKLERVKYIDYLKFSNYFQMLVMTNTEEMYLAAKDLESLGFRQMSCALKLMILQYRIMNKEYTSCLHVFLSLLKELEDIAVIEEYFKIMADYLNEQMKPVELRLFNEISIEELNLTVDPKKTEFTIDLQFLNEFAIPLYDVEIEIIFGPQGLIKDSEGEYKKQYWVQKKNIAKLDTKQSISLKSQVEGSYTLKKIRLNIFKYSIKLTIPKKAKDMALDLMENQNLNFEFVSAQALNKVAEDTLVAGLRNYIVLTQNVGFSFEKLQLKVTSQKKEDKYESGPFFTYKEGSLQIKGTTTISWPEGDDKFTISCSPNSGAFDQLAICLVTTPIFTEKENRFDDRNFILEYEFFGADGKSLNRPIKISVNIPIQPLLTLTSKCVNVEFAPLLQFQFVNETSVKYEATQIIIASENILKEPLVFEPFEKVSLAIDSSQCDQESLKIHCELNKFDSLKYVIFGFICFTVLCNNSERSSIEGVKKEILETYEPEKTELHYVLSNPMKEEEKICLISWDVPKQLTYLKPTTITIQIKYLKEFWKSDEYYEYQIYDENRCFIISGKTKNKLENTMDNSHTISLRLIPLELGELPLPKVVLNRMIRPLEEKKAIKRNLKIEVEDSPGLGDVNTLPESKCELRYTYSEKVIVFNEEYSQIESFSIIG